MTFTKVEIHANLEEEQSLYARVTPSGTLTSKQFIGLIFKTSGFSNAILEEFFLGISK